jgi:hypothetical protein
VDFVISVNDMASRTVDKVKGSFDKLGISAKDLGKSLGMSDDAMAELAAETGGLSLVAAAAAGALAILGVAAIAITTEVISANEELDKMTTQLGALGNEADGSGAQIVGMLDDMSKRLPETKDQLAEWAKPLLAAGVHGRRRHNWRPPPPRPPSWVTVVRRRYRISSARSKPLPTRAAR